MTEPPAAPDPDATPAAPDPNATLGPEPDPPFAAAADIDPARTTGPLPPSIAVPGFRDGIGRSLDLALQATDRLRPASIYIGLLLLAIAAPVILQLLVLLTNHPEFGDAIVAAATNEDLALDEQMRLGEWFLGLVPGIWIALVGLVALSIDGQVIAILLLGGRLIERPVPLRHAVGFARRRFWAVLRAGLLIGLPTVVLEWLLTEAFGPVLGPGTDATVLLASTLATFALLPFVYTTVGVVLGEVNAVEAARRSIRLEVARHRLAVLIAAVGVGVGAIQVFALGSGADVLARIGVGLGLGFDRGPVAAFATVALIMAAIVALGSLTFTVTAIAAAPQVIGFLALTAYRGAIDRAAQPEGGRPVPWISAPMLGGAAIAALIALVVIAGELAG
ncbi:MAG TPA: hypothetical protein VH720_02145 [Candidatus Limnocylindrales bacterium]|jgi:hypothetical protein